MCRRRQVVPEDRPRVERRTGAVGPPGRPARGRRRQDLLHRGHHLRPRSRGRPGLPDGRRGPQRHPHRGGPRQALRLGDGLADGRRAGPDPRRPRLRDRRVAGRARRAGRAHRADAPRHAHQPDLRGLDGDHAPADRPRGRRRPPLGRRGPHRPRQGPGRQGQGGSPRHRLLRPLAAEAGRRPRPGPRHLPGVPPGGPPRPRHPPALRRTRFAQTRPLHLPGHGALAGTHGDETGIPRPDRRHRRRALRHERRLRPRRAPARHRRPRPRGVPARRRLLPAVPAPRRGALRPPLVQHRRPRPQGRRRRPRRHLHLAGGRRPRPLGRRPVDRGRGPGPSVHKNVHRPLR